MGLISCPPTAGFFHVGLFLNFSPRNALYWLTEDYYSLLQLLICYGVVVILWLVNCEGDMTERFIILVVVLLVLGFLALTFRSDQWRAILFFF